MDGGGLSIGNGDASPSSAYDTDFGSAAVAGGTVEHTFTIRNSGTLDLDVTAIGVTGRHAANFTVGDIALPATVAGSSTIPFTVTFDPSLECVHASGRC